MTQPHPQPNPNELLSITREELERCCSQMSAAGYKVSANYVEAMVLSRSSTHTPAAPATEPKPLRYSGVTVFTPPELSRHDAAIRKAEREQVLDDIITFRKRESKEYKIHDMWVHESEYLESLRGGGAP
jgi:hypothetical protein